MPPLNSTILKKWGSTSPSGETRDFRSQPHARSPTPVPRTDAARPRDTAPEVFSEFFSARLKSARNSRGLSQRQLGALSTVQSSAIAHFESGRRLPTLATLCLLSQALGVSTDYLLGRETPLTTGTEFDARRVPATGANEFIQTSEEGDSTYAPPKKGAKKTPSEGPRQEPIVNRPEWLGFNLTYSVVEDLGSAIVAERYADPDKKFPAHDLCQHYGVGGAVIREAVAILKSKGLIASMPKRGTWVQPSHKWNLLDQDVLRWSLEQPRCIGLLVELTQLRLAVEPFAAGLAARAARPAQRTAVAAAMRQLEFALHFDDRLLESDINFHIAVLQASGNRFCSQQCNLVETALRHTHRLTAKSNAGQALNIGRHKKVADAIIASSASHAESAMRALIGDSLALICTVQKNQIPPANAAPGARNSDAASM
ncbi:MAG: FCD domain-containing protein [Rhizomicrobium sp.]